MILSMGNVMFLVPDSYSSNPFFTIFILLHVTTMYIIKKKLEEASMRKGLISGLAMLLLFLFISSADALCVKVPKANLRGGPGTKFEKTWHVFKYMPFKKISSKGNWFKIQDVDGDIHWIYRKLVTNSYNCAVVKVDEANIRTGPGAKFQKKEFGPALKYDTFKVLQRKGSWVKVIDEFENSGWIFRKLLWIY
jgi:SH3-like domain-containing protein